MYPARRMSFRVNGINSLSSRVCVYVGVCAWCGLLQPASLQCAVLGPAFFGGLVFGVGVLCVIHCVYLCTRGRGSCSWIATHLGENIPEHHNFGITIAFVYSGAELTVAMSRNMKQLGSRVLPCRIVSR